MGALQALSQAKTPVRDAAITLRDRRNVWFCQIRNHIYSLTTSNYQRHNPLFPPNRRFLGEINVADDSQLVPICLTDY